MNEMDGLDNTGLSGLFDTLRDLACRMGATDAVVVAAADISVQASLADLCRRPGCDNYGLGAGCPPHVGGPAAFKKMQAGFQHALVFKIDLPSEILFSADRADVFRLLHEISAAVEQAAVDAGCVRARGFAGGSCKPLFCTDHSRCRVIGKGGTCRNPEKARPSMSGYGIDVHRLMQTAGWPNGWMSEPGLSETVSMTSLCGLVLIG